MSSKRRQRGSSVPEDLFNIDNNEAENGGSDSPAFGSNSASDIADFGYSSARGYNDGLGQMTSREKIVFKPIEFIHPNRMQPRRALPSKVRHYFSESDIESMAYGFQLWFKEVELERQEDFPLDKYLEGEATHRVTNIEKMDTELEQTGSAPKLGSLETAFMTVVELAASIKRDGLINPISIARSGTDDKGNIHYEIETGERRWLAYHLLNWQYPESGWDKIPTRQVEGGVSIWRQANENNIRADLNAIAMARQFALLLMDILRDEKEFLPFEAFDNEHEQEFYAQVADGEQYRVPRNQGEKLLNAMNLENPVQLRQYRALLRLPRQVWQLADDLNWTEGFIRMEILGKGADDKDKVRLAYKHAKAEGYTVTDDTVYEELLSDSQPREKSSQVRYTYKHFSKTLGAKVDSYLAKLSGKERETTIAYLREMLERFEAQ